MQLNQDMGYVYIAERTSPEDQVVNNLSIHDTNGIFFVEFDSALHSFDVMNRNSRMYKSSNIEECLKTERIQHYLSHGGWFGEEDHPISKYKDRPLSPDWIQNINMKNTSHKMLNPHVEGNLLKSKIQSDAGTAAGMNLAKKMIQGLIPGFSCRAIAVLVLQAGKPVVDVKKIITYDWVLYQSHREAEQDTNVPNKFVSKTVNTVNESVDVVVPLKEILEDVYHTDVNSQMIMESFELDDTNLVGFSKGHKHIIIKDNDNMIYCNINQRSRKMVNDYLRSFK